MHWMSRRENWETDTISGFCFYQIEISLEKKDNTLQIRRKRTKIKQTSSPHHCYYVT